MISLKILQNDNQAIMRETMTLSFALTIGCLVLTGCASERIHVTVRNQDGFPVSNAVVSVRSMNKVILFGSDRAEDFDTWTTRTDESGRATVAFDSKNGAFDWWVVADGYYDSEFRKDHFQSEGRGVAAELAMGAKLLEHEKSSDIILYEKINPQPLFHYRMGNRRDVPWENGRYGFDLENFDWLPPHGKGVRADFYYVRNRQDQEGEQKLVDQGKKVEIYSFKADSRPYPKAGDVVGYIEFESGCGAYLVRRTQKNLHIPPYCADSTKEFQTRFPIVVGPPHPGSQYLQELPVIDKNHFMIIRSRVTYDEKGEMTSANYSKLVGPFYCTLGIGCESSYFNPLPNDTNLEFDPTCNLATP